MCITCVEHEYCICIYSRRQWCGTATTEWDSFKIHLKVIRMPRNSKLLFHGLN